MYPEKREVGITMAVDTYQRTSFGWQIQQNARQLGEWVELQFSKLFRQTEQWDIPELPLVPLWVTQALFWLGIVLVGLLLFWLIYELVNHYRDRIPWTRLKGRTIPRSKPVPTPSMNEWLRRAQELERQGQYAEACRALYFAALQALHDAKLIPQQDSRTDGEYLQRVADLKQSRPYQLLIRTHERSQFGDAPISLEILHRCQTAYREILKS